MERFHVWYMCLVLNVNLERQCGMVCTNYVEIKKNGVVSLAYFGHDWRRQINTFVRLLMYFPVWVKMMKRQLVYESFGQFFSARSFVLRNSIVIFISHRRR